MTIEESFKRTNKAQKDIVKYYATSGLKKAKDSIVVVNYTDRVLIDGHHRIMALASNGVRSVKALDLSEVVDE